MITKREISEARINANFQSISDYFGYDANEYIDEIVALVQLWQDQGFVEIYQTVSDRKLGFIKDSSLNSKGAIAPYYIGLFHARLLDGENDPLVVIKFHETNQGEIIDMRFMIDHEDFFGNRKTKRDSASLRAMWLEIDAKIKIGDQEHQQ
ncbi:MAG: hypothetical protein MJK04_22320 [Psychrosphaera sp.]|nr:hypothetical protein [Psychrosphaera sp.]